MTRIKVCGITNLEDALFCADLGVDALGFIFTDISPRAVSKETAKEIIENLPVYISKVGVFVDTEKDKILDIVNFCGLDYIQLHGQESPEFCEQFEKYKVIKAFKIKDRVDIEMFNKYNVSALLLDTYYKDLDKGQSRAFDWSLLLPFINVIGKRRLILAGGLNPENVSDAIRTLSPWCVDVASGVEQTPGKKDKFKLRDFVREVRNTDSELYIVGKLSEIFKLEEEI